MEYGPGSEAGRAEIGSMEGARCIRLAGECDVYLAPQVSEHLETLLTTGVSRIIFDLENVTFLDSSILSIFLTARRAAPGGSEVVLLCRAGFVRRLLGLLEMDRILQVCTPEEWRRQIAACH